MQVRLPEQAASLHIKNVILWSNGLCMVFSDSGEQMPEFQGPYEEVARSINNVFSGRWQYGNWKKGTLIDIEETIQDTWFQVVHASQ